MAALSFFFYSYLAAVFVPQTFLKLFLDVLYYFAVFLSFSKLLIYTFHHVLWVPKEMKFSHTSPFTNLLCSANCYMITSNVVIHLKWAHHADIRIPDYCLFFLAKLAIDCGWLCPLFLFLTAIAGKCKMHIYWLADYRLMCSTFFFKC